MMASHICSEKQTVFRERSSRKTVSFEEQIMSKCMKAGKRITCSIGNVMFPLYIGVVDIKKKVGLNILYFFHYEFIIFISVYLYSFFIFNYYLFSSPPVAVRRPPSASAVRICVPHSPSASTLYRVPLYILRNRYLRHLRD